MSINRSVKLFFSSSDLILNSFLSFTACISLLLLSIFKFTIGLPILFPLVLTGFIIWTLLEYILNRYLLHDITIRKIFSKPTQLHISHHITPSDPRYLIIHPSLIVTCALAIGIPLWLLFNESFTAIMAGFFAGYTFFIIIHFIQHHVQFLPTDFLFNLCKRHFLHHSSYPEKAFGVTTNLWDILFKTSAPYHELLKVNPALISQEKMYTVTEVRSPIEEEAFLNVSKKIYSNNPYYISPLYSEIKNIFNPDFNPCFKHGTAKRWILVNEHQEVVGRVAAFIDFEKMYDGDKKIGRVGFFECIEDNNVANLLLNHACNWLKEYYNVNAIDGPVNFGENDKYWGLLIEGFKHPSYGMNFNPSYYKEFFEKSGFEKQYEQLTNLVDLKKELPERFVKITGRVCQNPRYSFEHFTYSEKERFIKDFVTIYNQAWSSFKNFKEMSEEYLDKSLQQIKPVLVESFIWFAYVEGKPAGLLVGLPDLNEALKYMNGKFNLWSKIKFFMFNCFKGFTKARVVIMGIVPEFQRLGLESGLIYHAYQAGRKKPTYKYVQLAWVGDFNEKMIAIHRAMGAIPETRHVTYRKYL